MPILDSDILIGYLRDIPKCLEIFNDFRSNKTLIKTTVFNVAELYQGAYLSKKCEENQKKITKFLNTLTILDFNRKDA
ncbi:MAG: VapC toxin family PIN domain ribonuclease, partial [Promethearchaeota archaeon]